MDNGYFVVASNWGQEKNAVWYFKPNVIIEMKGKTLPVIAREAEGDEYAKLWATAVSRHPDYLHYKEMTARHIPIMVFE